MFNLTKKKFNDFPKSNKAMIYLMWIYHFWNLISTLFISIYIFKLESNISNVIIYNIIFFTTVFLWFDWLWYLYSQIKKSVKSIYYIWYTIFILSFTILLLFWSTILWIYIFWAFYWFAFWAFRCAVHANELTNIKDKDRDFYSSLISAWWNILQIITPLIVSFIFIIANKINYNWYYILFFVIPIVYMISFIFIKDTWDYIPTKINNKDIKNFFNFKKYIWWHTYIFLTWVTHALKVVAIPIIAILILKNEVNIWFFESVMWIVSFFIIIFLSHKRNTWNRIKILWIISILILLCYIFFSLYFNLYWYIIFSLILIILNPLYRVSEHVYDLKIMDTIKNRNSDFFPSMLLRETIIWPARIFILFVSLYLVTIYWDNLELLLKILLIISWFMYFFTWFAIKMHVKYENHDKIKDLD